MTLGATFKVLVHINDLTDVDLIRTIWVYKSKCTFDLYRIVKKFNWSDKTVWKRKDEAIPKGKKNGFVSLKARFVEPRSMEESEDTKYLTLDDEDEANLAVR